MAGKAIYDWDTVAANNASADSTITQSEGMAAALVNNSSRAEMARLAAFIALLGGNTALVTYGGLVNAYTVTSPSGHAFTNFPTGLLFTFIPNITNTSASTLALDGMATKAIISPSGAALVAGDLVAAVPYFLRYNGTSFIMMSPTGGGAYAAADADLTALAALATAGIIARTGAGTVATRTVTAPAAGITVTNGDGVAGNPTLALANDLAALEGLSTTGLIVRTADGAMTTRALTNGTSISITNGDGVAGAPTINVTGLAIGVNVQAFSANLTTFAAIAPSANVQSFLGAADYAAMRTQLSLVVGTNVQAQSANLTTFAAIAPSANVQSLLGAADYAAMRTQLSLVPGTNVQTQSANLNTWAGLAPSANAQSLVTAADYAAMRTLLTLVIGTNVQAQSAKLAALAASTAVTGTITSGTAAASGGADGDIYLKYV
jgi:hypothetical protein